MPSSPKPQEKHNDSSSHTAQTLIIPLIWIPKKVERKMSPKYPFLLFSHCRCRKALFHHLLLLAVKQRADHSSVPETTGRVCMHGKWRPTVFWANSEALETCPCMGVCSWARTVLLWLLTLDMKSRTIVGNLTENPRVAHHANQGGL